MQYQWVQIQKITKVILTDVKMKNEPQHVSIGLLVCIDDLVEKGNVLHLTVTGQQVQTDKTPPRRANCAATLPDQTLV